MIQSKIKDLIDRINEFKSTDLKIIEEFRISMLGKKGAITEIFDEFRALSSEEKKTFGAAINSLKKAAIDKINELKEQQSTKETLEKSDDDLTRPSTIVPIGSRHPISLVKNSIVEIFEHIGYSVAKGPEIEDDWHVFSALNFPPEHPARDMQDTFFVEKNGINDILLRTHTSSVQVRTMERQKPPIRVICPGRVFRNEAISYRAHCIFHQIEGLYIDEGVSFADLKQTIEYFAKEYFGPETKIRMRPSYFPFTEPSTEIDVSCNLCGGKGCGVCKHTGWLEVMGAGMCDPNILEASGIDSKKYTGFAFGMGVERIAMLKYGVKDLRLYFENDLRFLRQFSTEF